MPWLSVNHTLLCWFRAVPTPDLALEVQRGAMPGHPGAKRSEVSLMNIRSLAKSRLAEFRRRKNGGRHHSGNSREQNSDVCMIKKHVTKCVTKQRQSIYPNLNLQ